MIVRHECDWTVIQDVDLHDNGFKIAHFHPNSHVSLCIPRGRDEFHTRELGRSHAYHFGTALLRFARTGQLTEIALKDDFQI